MGATAFVLIMIVMLFAGVIGFFIGLAGLIVSIILRKFGKKWATILIVITAIVLIVSLVIALIPIGFFTFIYRVNTEPPLDFVETDIVIEENGYQEERFTADGVVYEVLPLEADFEGCSAIATPVFSYYTEGFLKGSQCGNYFDLAVSADFTLIWDGLNLLFSTAEEREEILTYYDEAADSAVAWSFFDWTNYEGEEIDYTPLSAEGSAAMDAFVTGDYTPLPARSVTLTDYRDISVKGTDADGAVLLHSISAFFLSDGQIYYTNTYEYADDGSDAVICTAVVLPDEIGRPLLEAFGQVD